MAWLKILVVAAVAGYLAVALAGVGGAGEAPLLSAARRRAGPCRLPAGSSRRCTFKARDGTQLAGVLVKPPVERAAARHLLRRQCRGSHRVTRPCRPDLRRARGAARELPRLRRQRRQARRDGELVSDGSRSSTGPCGAPTSIAPRVALHGRSLGTGVAVQVAAARPPRCVILTSPFDSARAVAQTHLSLAAGGAADAPPLRFGRARARGCTCRR